MFFPPDQDVSPGTDVFRVSPDVPRRGLSAVVARGGSPALGEAVEREWARLAALNPRLYNGPLLSVLSIDLDRGEFLCRRDSFARLVAQPVVKTGVSLLAVSALITARDAEGREHVLLARRGQSTRVYPGRWENGPAGGITPPPPNVEVIEEAAMRANLREEMEEEIGLVVEPRELIALVRDNIAFSHDLVFRCDAGLLEAAVQKMSGANWEYSETKWTPTNEIADFDARHGDEIIGPTRAIFRVMKWA